MRLTAGRFEAEGADTPLLEACRRANALTIEATIRADDVTQNRLARIITFSSSTSSRNFTLGQQRDRLVLHIRTPLTGNNAAKPQVLLCRLKPGRWTHVIAAYRPGLLVCHADGKRVLTTRELKGDLYNWEPQHLVFGDEHGGGRDSAGRLEGVALYSRFIEPKEAADHHALYARRLADRTPVPRLVVEARLLEVVPTPSLKSIAPYRRCLAEYVYQVARTIEGDGAPPKLIACHWVVLDEKPLPVRRTTGKTYRLTLEPFDGHPELGAERRIPSDTDDLDLPVYYDVGS